MSTINFEVSRGDNATLRFNIKSLPVSGLTGSTLYFKAKRDKTDPDSAAVTSKDSTNVAQINIVQVGSDTVDGIADVFLLPADTSGFLSYTVALVYDLVVKDSSAKPYTVASGALVVTTDVNQAQ